MTQDKDVYEMRVCAQMSWKKSVGPIYRSGVSQDFGVGNAKKQEKSDRITGTSGIQV